jgi:hypothetical protein
MSELIYAADAIRASIRQSKALLEYADVLEKVGSIEQAEKEAILATNNAKKDFNETAEQLSLMKELLANAVNSSKKEKSSLEESLNEMKAAADAEIQALKAKAKQQANKTILDAEVKADSIVDGAQTKLVEIQNALATTKEELQKTIEIKQRAEDDLAAINSKIEQAKALVSNVFKG